MIGGGTRQDVSLLVGDEQGIVAPGLTINLRFPIEGAGFVTVQIGSTATLGQEGADHVGVEQGAGQVDFRLRGKGRVAVLGDQQRRRARQTLLVEVRHGLGEPRRRLLQVRRHRRADVVERVPLERQESQIVRSPTRLQIAQQAGQPRPVGSNRSAGPGHHWLIPQGLEGWPTERYCRIDRTQRVHRLQIQGPIVLRSNVLAIRFLAEFDAAQRIAAPLQIAQQGGGVVRRIVEHPDGNQHRQAMRQPAGEHPVNAGLLDVGVQVGRTVPWVGG
ncbi:MAG: hypothetical protein AW09_002447 [Candidatus Accumulibacter phosphatis]|uniref:Uncharacterized protein n=1 Tax=Candidatus Accumulibacter phosphatis TaxID=327160 RepID=A0A080LUY6_9PROT|nr:MAG: hypothetical protein AW09_002447 [Candidatus Accumulibacter phosphatis]